MKFTKLILMAALALFAVACGNDKKETSDPNLIMWYTEPSKEWVEALPLGNGRIGAMVFGRPDRELIQLNEETLWAGGPVNPNPNPDSPKWLPEIRKALFAGDYAKAEQLTKNMQGLFTESYAPLGDLVIEQQFSGTVQNYYRDLDLNRAVSQTRFTVDGVAYTREIFVTAADQVMVVRLTSDQKYRLNFTAGLTTPLRAGLTTQNDNTLVLSGQAPAHADPSYVDYNPEPIIYSDTAGMRFQLLCQAISKDGTVFADSLGLHVQGASEAILILSAATSFNGFDKNPVLEGRDEQQLAQSWLSQAAAKSYPNLLEAHTRDYQSLFNRMRFTLHQDAVTHNRSMAERLEAYLAGGEDKALEALYFQFGRYLMISASRPGGIPMNLQGIWNNMMRPPWSSNYTININTEMNYWPAGVCNLAETQEPFLQLIKNQSVTGARTARNFYDANGWCSHHNTDIWAQTNPVGNIGKGSPQWANWPMGGVWQCMHLFEHYRYTGDRKYLADFAYPVMKSAAMFVFDWLIEGPDGYLVTAPATSPENTFYDQQGKARQVSIATTCDMVLIWDLFTNLIETTEALGVDPDFRQQLLDKRDRLYPLQIGAKGSLQEWFEDAGEPDPEHRHISHLIGLHPGRQISPLVETDLANACKRTLEMRGDDGTGWALGWKINTWARLLDGDHAYRLVRNLLRVTSDDVSIQFDKGGGSYLNLFCAHPPFQIDGNFGGTAGMAEMLIQSHRDEIHLLPALPTAWDAGEITGLCARDGFTVDMQWKANSLTEAKIESKLGHPCTIRTETPVKVKGLELEATTENKLGKTYYVISFPTEAGKIYTLQPTTL